MTGTRAAQPAARRPRARRGEGDRLREEILDATSRLLLETGDHEAVNIRSVAQAVGVTPPSIYLHFADKAELIKAVCGRHFGSLEQCIEAAVASTDDPAEQLRLRGKAYVRFGLEHPEQYRILFMSRRDEACDKAPDEGLKAASGFTALVDNVVRAAEAGAIDAPDPLLVATGLWTVVHGITSLAISIPHYPVVGLDVLVDHILDVHRRGLRH
ncbi:MAG: TetR/AcrR family transcriptional regulator [Acidimicrobiales bacterium]